MNARRALPWAAFSLGSLLYLRIWFELNHLQQQPIQQYFLGRAATESDYLVAVAGALLLGLLLVPLMVAMLSRKRPILAATGTALTAILLGRVLFQAAGLSELVPEISWWQIQDEAGELWFSGVAGVCLAAISVLAITAPGSRAWLTRAGPRLAVFLVVLAPFGLLMIANAAYHAWQSGEFAASTARAAERTTPVARATDPGAARLASPRVIVMVFDELDYRLVFESLPQGLALRGLPRLRALSLFATQAFAPSNATAMSLPAMLLGERVINVQGDGWSRLNLYRENGSTISFADADTLVHRATRAGHRVGMLGWYHAYCRVFPQVADCLESAAYGYSTSYAASNWLDIMAAQWRQIIPISPSYAAMRYQHAVTRFRSMLANEALGLVFAHFSIPHVPYIHDGRLQQLVDADRMAPVSSSSVNYFANLQLVDRLLDETLDTMKASCADCVLVVTSDHWWRWSRHYDGRTDRRVPFAVYSPRETGSLVAERKFNVEILAHLVMAILERKVTTREEIARWIGRNGRARDPALAPWMLDDDRLATSHEPPGMPR